MTERSALKSASSQWLAEKTKLAQGAKHTQEMANLVSRVAAIAKDNPVAVEEFKSTWPHFAEAFNEMIAISQTPPAKQETKVKES